ncbi:hypothetical protein [Streptomyces sp. NPDC058739]|uniref:hypothetical protein n=1 Tax=Streptomyces sp. NPDC058739 TaxID=3346618 RepID=UPI0036BC49BB
MTERESILQGIQAATWSFEDATAYEVALDGMDFVVGAFSRLISEAEAANDTDRAEALTAEQRRWASRRDGLTPADRAEVHAVTAECAPLLARLRGTT